ncbi:MAG: SprT family zinc-dependent metalloprotease [Spirochaetia bacterium]|jgi:predicted metal-dependent hydrolase|nr:SprT family zinc-dependent metalloprotease [Spirochaetia bacterium]
MQQITVSGITFELIRKDIKTIRLTVYAPDGRVRVSAPVRVGEDTVKQFVKSKLPWIRRRLIKFEGSERLTQREYKNRESHFFQGERYLLDVIETQGRPKVEVRGAYLDLYIKPGSGREKRHDVMNAFYRREMKKQLPDIIDKWEKEMKISAGEVRIRQMKTRWGSCNIKKKRIWLNLELAKKPLPCLEYVVVHEMTHYFERLHNSSFKTILSSYLPDWRELKDQLNRFPVSHTEWNY